MKLSLRLSDLLAEQKVPPKVADIARETRIERHKISALLNNQVQYLNLDVLAELCEYLVTHCGVPRAELPGSLFRQEREEGFWSLFANRDLEVCMGERTARDENEPPWVMASDTLLHGELMRQLTISDLGRRSGEEPTRTRLQELHLVIAYGRQVQIERAEQSAREAYRKHRNRGTSRALVCLGSVKSNPLIELVTADAFGAAPFRQELPTSAGERRCPFFLKYRETDPDVPSCCAGTSLSSTSGTTAPGIHYESGAGRWKCVPSSNRSDAALVFFHLQPKQRCLELVLGGFSGRATQSLAHHLARVAPALWPPTYQLGNRQIGAYIVRFSYKTSTGAEASLEEVIPLAESSLARRLKRTTPRSATETGDADEGLGEVESGSSELSAT